MFLASKDRDSGLAVVKVEHSMGLSHLRFDEMYASTGLRRFPEKKGYRTLDRLFLFLAVFVD